MTAAAEPDRMARAPRASPGDAERIRDRLHRGGRLIAANVDCELAWAGSGRLPLRVAARVSAAAVALAALARDGDVLWTPAPVEPARVGDAPWIGGVMLASGDMEALPAPAEILAWGETDAVARLRAAAPSQPPRARGGPLPWHERLWRLPVPSPALAARCNHRRFAFEIGRAIGCALPGARFVASVGELETHLRRGGARAGDEEAWVLKAPLSAAGRDRIHRRGRALDRATRVRAERLLSRFGPLLFEPWLARCGDFGIVGAVTDGGVLMCPPHRIEADRHGVFRGIVIDDAGARDWFASGERDRLAAAAAALGDALRDAGYRGPFGIDAFAYTSRDGQRRFHPLCELNARLSFGLIARAAAERLGATGAPARVRLVFGPRDAAPPPPRFAIARPSESDATGAWLYLAG